MSGPAAKDRRRQLLRAHPELNGLDHVELAAAAPSAAPALRATFVNPLGPLPTPAQLRVDGGDRIPTVAVTAVEPTTDPRTALVTLASRGDRSRYTLRLVTGAGQTYPPDWVDPVLASACFSFQVARDDGLPCDGPPAPGPAAAAEPRLDYLARDWESLRAVLFDRLSVLQPTWTRRDAADQRVMLVELLAELGDRLSYRQDAIATEAYLATARRRVSARRHARLVDYAMSDGTNARTWVQLAVSEDELLTSGGTLPVVPAGLRLLTGGSDAPALLAAGSPAAAAAVAAGALEFQTLSTLDVLAGAHNAMRFHTWSGERPALAAGATSATLAGHLPHLAVGQVLVLVEHRDPVGPARDPRDADPDRRQAVRLTAARATDAGGRPLRDRLTGEAVTEIAWHAGDALAFPLLVAGTLVTGAGGEREYDDGALALGNIVLADHGQAQPAEQLGPVPATGRIRFRLARGPLTQVARQVVDEPLRDGSGTREVVVPFVASGSAASAVDAAPDLVLPDVSLAEDGDGRPWEIRRDLLRSGAARDFVVEVDDDGFGWLRFGEPVD
ncbi:putative baseplate assembly protein, partial [Frankia sp. CNm7]